MAMLKGSMKAVVIYRRAWSKSNDSGVAKTPFCNRDKTHGKQWTLMSISSLNAVLKSLFTEHSL